MNKSRSIVMLGSLGLVLILALSWVFLLSPRMTQPQQLKDQTAAVEVESQVLQSEIVELQTKKDAIASAKVEGEALARRFPATAEEATLFGLLRDAASRAGIPERRITDVIAGVPVIGSADGSVTLPAEPAPTDPNAAPTPGQVPTTPEIATAAPTAAQLATMTLDLTVSGSRAQIEEFLMALENMDRAFLVSTVTLGETSEGGDTSATINGVMFLLPELVDPTATPAEPGVPGGSAS